ncbi:hypothetical protein [Deinococcus xianganensis]|nr:hypothetical protein [Deinococcus xianganensis]
MLQTAPAPAGADARRSAAAAALLAGTFLPRGKNQGPHDDQTSQK